MRESKNYLITSFSLDFNLLKRNIKYSLMWPSRSHVTKAIIKNAISSKFRKRNRAFKTQLKPILRYIILCTCMDITFFIDRHITCV